nr:MAG TPA: hypothetical protein [Caudoviricetes sp.]
MCQAQSTLLRGCDLIAFKNRFESDCDHYR